MFWKNFIILCNSRNLSPNAVCAELGYSTAIATKWKNGSVPRSSTLQKIADYFGVSVESLTEDSPSPTTETTSKTEEIIKKLNIDKMDDKQLEMLTKYAEFLVSQSDKD